MLRAAIRAVGVLTCLLAAFPAAAQYANLAVYAFNEGAPVRGIEILVDDDLVSVTNEYGTAELQLDP
ncbi:MAG: hypothetical protein ACK2U9_17545, partial [Anaerolineae bacterium]